MFWVGFLFCLNKMTSILLLCFLTQVTFYRICIEVFIIAQLIVEIITSHRFYPSSNLGPDCHLPPFLVMFKSVCLSIWTIESFCCCYFTFTTVGWYWNHRTEHFDRNFMSLQKQLSLVYKWMNTNNNFSEKQFWSRNLKFISTRKSSCVNARGIPTAV